MQEWFTTQELADTAKRLKLNCLPHSLAGAKRHVKSNEWNAFSVDLVRRRKGLRGGGMEYHVSILPQVMQSALQGEVHTALAVDDADRRGYKEVAIREAVSTTDLSARQRAVMNARSVLLMAIEVVQIAQGSSRAQAVEKFLENPCAFAVEESVLSVANDRSGGSLKISRRTLLRWFKFRDENGIGALAPKATKNKADLPSWFWDFMAFYARPQKPCITEAFEQYKQTLNDTSALPSYSQIRRMIGKLGNVEKHKGREGSLTLKARMAYVTRSTSGLFPTCVFTADGKTFDAEVANPYHGRPFKPEITSVVDVATRRCVGFSIGIAENTDGVVDALRHACEQYGIPAIFYVDRGAGFKNDTLDNPLTGLMGRLGITKHHSLPQNSQARGIIERFNGSVWNKLAREYATYIGVEMDRQASQKSFKKTRKEVAEFGHSRSVQSWEGFLEACNRAIAVYNAKPHSALPDNMSPDEYWQTFVDKGFEAISVTPAESNDLFRYYEKRKTNRALVTLGKNEYFAIELEPFHGDYVLVGYDQHDASKVWIRAIENNNGEEQAGKLICIAKFAGNEERYIPVTMQRLAQEKRAKTRAKRLEDKLEEVSLELDPVKMLEASANKPIKTTIDNTVSFEEIYEPAQIVEPKMVPIPREPKFGNEAELALWAIDNPDQLKSSQRKALENCIADRADRELLRDNGVNIEKLKEVISRAA